jgi:CRP-like cAMP-binding protein
MSQMLGASRQSINRLLKQWEQGGVIEVAYRSLTVLDPEALRALTERDGG